MLANKIHCAAVALSFFPTNFSVALTGLSSSSFFLCPWQMPPEGQDVTALSVLRSAILNHKHITN